MNENNVTIIPTHHVGSPTEINSIHHNPKVVQAIQIFETGEMSHTVDSCVTCNETRPIYHCSKPISREQPSETIPILVQPWKIFKKEHNCKRCHLERNAHLKKGLLKAAKFSGIYSPECDLGPKHHQIRHNNMHFEPVPPYLQNLSTVETALISRITVVMNIHLLRYGMLASKGHTVSLPQPMNIASNLPRLPTDVGLIILRRKGKHSVLRQYTVERHIVENALIGLCFGFPTGGILTEQEGYKKYYGPDHNMLAVHGRYFLFFPNAFYKDAIISKDRLNNLPTHRAQLPGIQVIEVPTITPEEDKGPAEEQFRVPVAEDDESVTRSGITCPLPPGDIDSEMKLMIDRLIGKEGAGEQALQAGQVAAVDWEYTKGEPLSELKTPGFFTMAYPTVFINGSCDITVPGLTPINFEEYVQHIYFTTDNRVADHPFLKFLLLNLRLRMQALKQGSYVVAQQLNDAHLTIPQLRENIENEDQSVPRKIISIAANLPNTHPYWREKKRELDAFTFFQRKEFGDLSVYFDTNSCAEFHWKPLLELLITYYCKTNNCDENDVRQKVDTNPKFKKDLIFKNLHIVTSYFDSRTINYYATVGKELFQYSDMWWRYEFAKSRGEIHSHALINSVSHYKQVESAMAQSLPTQNLEDEELRSNAVEELHKWLQTSERDEAGVYSPNFVSMHPAGGHQEIDVSGNRSWLPNKNQWAAPEGTQPAPDYNPLNQELHDICRSDGGIAKHHTFLDNRVGLHKCNGYCLRTKKTKGPMVDNVRTEMHSKYCRFHFAKQNSETKEVSGKEIHPFKPVISEGEYPKYDGPRDHPRLIQHVKARLISWLANCDTQVIIDQDLMSLQRYIAGYTCKGAATTEDLIQIYRCLIQSVSDQTTVRCLAQRLLLKAIGMIDTPAAAADFMNTGGKLQRCTRNFNKVGLSGYRQLKNSREKRNINATRETPLDKFLSERRCAENSTITL